MPQASQSPTSPRPDERRDLLAAPCTPATSLATHFVPPWAVTKAPASPRSAWPRVPCPVASGSGPAATPTRSPNTSMNRRPCWALLARLSPESQLALSLFGLTEVTSFPLAGISQYASNPLDSLNNPADIPSTDVSFRLPAQPHPAKCEWAKSVAHRAFNENLICIRLKWPTMPFVFSDRRGYPGVVVNSAVGRRGSSVKVAPT